jgi:hypothetical protein
MDDVAAQFTTFYYQTFAANRAGLQSLYVRPLSFSPSPGLTIPARGLQAKLGGLTSNRSSQHH